MKSATKNPKVAVEALIYAVTTVFIFSIMTLLQELKTAFFLYYYQGATKTLDFLFSADPEQRANLILNLISSIIITAPIYVLERRHLRDKNAADRIFLNLTQND